MKISDLLLDPHLDFLRFPKHKTGWGVRYTELLHMKISDLLLEPDLDYLRFPKHETGWGG